MRPHRQSTSKKDAHSQSNISSKQQYHQHSKSNRTATTSSARKPKRTTKTKGAASCSSPSRKEETNRTPDRRQLNLAITVEKPSPPAAPTKESNYLSSKDIVVVVEPHAQLSTPASGALLSTNSSPDRRQHRASSTLPSQESTSSSRSASSSSLASSSSSVTASTSSSSSFCRHCLRPQRELQLRYVRHRRHKKPEINQELPITSHNTHPPLGIAQPSILSDGVHNRRTSKRSMGTTTSSNTVRAGGSQRTAHRSSAGALMFAPAAVAAGTAPIRHRQRHMQRFSQPLTTTTIRIESEGGGASSTSRNQNLNQNLSVTTPNLLTVSGASSNRSSRSGPASSSRSGELDQQTPDSPSLVKVRTWYTVAKQGVSC